MSPPLSFTTTAPAAAALVALLLNLAPATGFAAAGRVNFAYGNVTSVTADGKARRLRRGSAVNRGETIKTARGRAQISFTDGSYTSLLPDTEFRVDEYQFKGKADTGKRSFFSLFRGGMRTITGLIGKVRRKSYRVRTPTATIGIRGTQYFALLFGTTLQVTVPPTSPEAVVLTTEGGELVVAPGQTGICTDSSSACSATPTTSLVLGPATLPPVVPPYSAPDDVDDDGVAGVVPPPPPPPPVVVEPPPPPPPTGPCTDAAQCIAFTFGNSDGEAGIGVLGLQSATFSDPAVDRPDLDSFTTMAGDVVTRNSTGVIGPVSNAQQGKADGLTWGRWRASGASTGGAGGPFPFPVKITGGGGRGGLMYVVGPPTMDMPTSGVATFVPSCSPKCAGQGNRPDFTTVRSSVNGGGGDLRSGMLAVDFGSLKVGADFTVEHQDAAFIYNVRTTGGLADPSQSQISIISNTFANTAPVFASSATDCGTGPGCPTSINGFFSGPGAAAAGFAYNIKSDTEGNVFGAAAFVRQ